MKNVLFLLAIVFLVFVGCDGKDRVHLTNSEILKEHKLLDSFSEKVKYIPEQYSEVVTDSLYDNGFRVKIKMYTDLDRDVLFTKTEESITYKEHYRNFKFDILIEKNNSIIYQKSFDKDIINKELAVFSNNIPKSSLYFNFGKLAVLKYIEVDYEPSLKNMIIINFMYAIPNTDRYSTHSLIVNDKGNGTIIHKNVN